MTTTAYDVGDLKRLTAVTKDIAAALTDPGEVTLYIRLPDWSLVTKTWVAAAEVVRDSLGTFHFDYTIVQAGRHIVSWQATGAVVEVSTLEFYARRREATA